MALIDRLTRGAVPLVVNPVKLAARSALIYMLCCGLYIVVSGRVAAAMAESAEQLQRIETIKGLLFILVTGGLFFLLSYARLKRLQLQALTIRKQEESLVLGEKREVAAMHASTVAHDLNNLLMCLGGLVEGLKSRGDDDEFTRSMREDVERGIGHVSRLSRRMASIAKQGLPQEEEAVDLRTTLPALAKLTQAHPEAAGCTIKVGNLPGAVLTLNRPLLETAVVNLLINAVQAAGKGGRVELRLVHEGEAFFLEVHDSGPGVAEEVAGQIFDPCFSTKPGGTGLGLLSVKAFAGSCGGEVSVDRSPLGGAVFRIHIPEQAVPSVGGMGTPS